MIREIINSDFDLLPDEQLLIKIPIRQLIGIANNLNPFAVAKHSGKSNIAID